MLCDAVFRKSKFLRWFVRGTAACCLLIGLLAISPECLPVGVTGPPLFRPATESIPVGFYSVRRQNSVGVGDIIRLCPPLEVTAFARARGYVGPGGCPGGSQKWLKMVGGIAGDTVLVDSTGVHVNGRFLAGTVPQREDSKRRAMPAYVGLHHLVEGECLLVTPHDGSVDSRYFGPLPCAAPFQVMIPAGGKLEAQVDSVRRRIMP